MPMLSRRSGMWLRQRTRLKSPLYAMLLTRSISVRMSPTGINLGHTLRSSNDSASILPCSSPLRIATSRPARVRIPSITARPSSKLVRVVARAPSRAIPPKKVPTRSDSDVDWVNKDTNDATGRGRRVVPEVAGGLDSATSLGEPESVSSELCAIVSGAFIMSHENKYENMKLHLHSKID